MNFAQKKNANFSSIFFLLFWDYINIVFWRAQEIYADLYEIIIIAKPRRKNIWKKYYYNQVKAKRNKSQIIGLIQNLPLNEKKINKKIIEKATYEGNNNVKIIDGIRSVITKTITKGKIATK